MRSQAGGGSQGADNDRYEKAIREIEGGGGEEKTSEEGGRVRPGVRGKLPKKPKAEALLGGEGKRIPRWILRQSTN